VNICTSFMRLILAPFSRRRRVSPRSPLRQAICSAVSPFYAIGDEESGVLLSPYIDFAINIDSDAQRLEDLF
jgi:hypothetical protein